MHAAVVFLSLLPLLPSALADDAKPRAGRLPAGCEVVMSPGMRITATTPEGKITITAVDELTRSYGWDGATRAVEMEPHKSRFFGSLGLYHDAMGIHWREHQGIMRCFTKEGQQHNKSVDEAMNWIKETDRMSSVYSNNGLMVGWRKDVDRMCLIVEVWQILIDGKKPKQLPGSQDHKIVVETVETETVPLVRAVARNDLKAVTALLAKGADANVKNSVEIPVLVMAIRRGSAPMVEALLKNKADPNVRDVDTDFTPLLEAIDLTTSDRTHIFKLLLDAGADANAASRKEDDTLMGFTPLMFAAESECEELVQLLLSKGANVNAKARLGITALSLAKSSGTEKNKGVIRKLEAARAKHASADDTNSRAGGLPAGDEVVMSPGMRITATTSVGTMAITAVDEPTRSYTWDGATRAVERSPEAVRNFGGAGVFHFCREAHWRDHHGITRCFTKEGQKHFKTVEEAMKWIKEPDRASFVYRADGLMVGWDKIADEKALRVEVWQILIDGKKPKQLPGSQDEKIVVVTVETETVPLVKAVASNDLKAATSLLAKGADANVKNSVEIPVLVMAIRRGAAPMVEALLKNRADPNVRDVDTDLTPLFETLYREARDRADIAKMLLAAGADMSAASRKEEDSLMGATPLMLAAANGCDDLVQLLLDKGADVNAKTPGGYTALWMAKSFGLHEEDNQGVIRKLEAAGAK